MSFIRGMIAWIFYLAGVLVMRWNDHERRFTQVGHDIWQWFMVSSDRIQGEQAEFGPWHKRGVTP